MGYGEEVDKVAAAMVGPKLGIDDEKRPPEFDRVALPLLVVEPERSIFTAADVVLAVAVAAGGRG